MPWARTDWMSERVKFVAAFLEHEGHHLVREHVQGLRRRSDVFDPSGLGEAQQGNRLEE